MSDLELMKADVIHYKFYGRLQREWSASQFKLRGGDLLPLSVFTNGTCAGIDAAPRITRI